MSQALFRQQAIDQQGERLWGELILSQPISYYVITTLLSSITLIAFLFLVLNDYTRKQQVVGFLVPDRGIVYIYPPRTGLLIDLKVKQNDWVEEGEVLFVVQVEQRVSEEELISEQLLRELNIQEWNLRERVNLEEQDLSLKMKRHSSRITETHSEIIQLSILLEIEEKLEAIKLMAFERASNLNRQGYISNDDLGNVHSEYLVRQYAVRSLNLQISNAESELDSVIAEKESLQINHRKEIGIIETEISEIRKQQARLHVDKLNKVLSPITGRVSNLNVSIGQTANMQSPLLAIIPENSTLEAQLLVPTRAVAFLERGQEVNIRFDAFPYQKFGLQKGHIKEISRSILIQSEIEKSIQISEPVYKVVVRLDDQSVKAYGQAVELKPGMMLSADVLLEERSLFEWLFEPLFSIKGKL